MKKNLLTTFVFLFLCFAIKAQNIVPNWSFEDTVACPDGQSEVYNATYWSSFGDTPDYFNACSQVMNVPHTPGGFQNAYSGNAFCGVYTYDISGMNYREYIGSQLINPLIIGQKYFVTFELNKPNEIECATNNFGALFSTVPYTYTNPVPINITPQIITSQIITDTLNWVNISGSFIADSAYKYIMFGNFYDDSNTDTLIYHGYTDCIAYYFIDMVCVSTDSLTCNLTDEISEINKTNDLINIYPNPANSFFTIRTDMCFENNIKIELFNITGAKLFEKIYRQTPMLIDIKGFSDGFYTIKINIDKKKFEQKLVILNQ